MPTDTSPEKASLLLKLGAIVDLVPPAPIIDPAHFVNRARSLAAQHTLDGEAGKRRGRGFFADQFETEANWRCHYEGTGREIWEGTGGRVDAFVGMLIITSSYLQMSLKMRLDEQVQDSSSIDCKVSEKGREANTPSPSQPAQAQAAQSPA